jgi:hypothetical protein
MADEAQMAKAMRTQMDYEKFKGMPAFDRYIQWGGRPEQRDTGLSDADYNRFIDALEFGRTITSDFTEDVTTGLGGIEGVDVSTTETEGKPTKIELSPSEKFKRDAQRSGPFGKKKFVDDEFLPRR